MNKELVKQLYCNGLNAREISQQLGVNKAAVNKCIQRNFKDLKPIHLENRKQFKFYENEVRKITKYESKQYMSDKTFILKNRSFYETKKDGDIGIENASPESIIKALNKVRTESSNKRDEFGQIDLIRNNLIGNEDASYRRDKIGQILGIGYGNAKQFLSRLNNYGVSREEFVEAVNSIDNTEE